MNILQGDIYTCIRTGTLKGFPFKTSPVCQMLEPELHSSVAKLLETNELDHFIDSETGIKSKCFQDAIFRIGMDSVRDQNAVLAIQLLN